MRIDIEELAEIARRITQQAERSHGKMTPKQLSHLLKERTGWASDKAEAALAWVELQGNRE